MNGIMSKLSTPLTTAKDWTALVKSGNRDYLGSTAAVPRLLMDQLMSYRPDLVDVEICQ